MAERHDPIRQRIAMNNLPHTHHSQPGWQRWPGILLALAITVLAVSGVGALLWQAPAIEVSELWASAYLRNVLVFTVWQAVLSVTFSLLLALPVARALDRYRVFIGRTLLLRLMELSLVIPTIVAVSGVVAIYGRQGWLTTTLGEWVPFLKWNLYGINGIVLTHVFFNAPLAARILLQAFENAPVAQRRIASQLALGRLWLWRAVEWPAIRPVLPGIVALIFTLCFTSFAIVMTLGGGPRATTLEVAIYQALRFEFDFGRAALLAVVQLLICGALWWLALRKGISPTLAPDRALTQNDRRKNSSRVSLLTNTSLLVAFTIFLLLPLIAVFFRGFPGLADAFLQPSNGVSGSGLCSATIRSFIIAVPAGFLAVVTSLLILFASNPRISSTVSRLCETSAYVPLVVPPLVLGTGLFLLLRPRLGVPSEGLVLVSLINSLMALPFVLQLLRGAFKNTAPATLQQADQLGILGWHRWRWIYWPRMRRPLALGMAYGIGLSLGDFGVIALFGSPGSPTLPVLLYQQLGSYQMQAAAATGLWLILLLLFVFGIFSLLGRRSPTVEKQTLHSRRILEPTHA
ncbi:MAG TPA: thiamine/thiamine pyrophosphate ABC transporter permease [Marinobacter sp.]|nr:thiamine/thiamine pyrophosphate ABC transporter permease [Marinobacter sp.]